MVERFLSQTSEYALRATACLALLSPSAPMRARDLAEHSGIPGHYLAKILGRLVRAGVLESRKGRGGGFSLSRPPGKITFEQVLSAVDTFPLSNHCAFGWGACNAARPCPLHDSWTEMNDEFSDWAATTTFADLRELPRGRRRRMPRSAAR